MKTGYIFDMRLCRLYLAWMLAVALTTLSADPNDVESSHDYAAFPRPAGYVITDYDEDNPASFDFPVARPLPIDADNMERVHVTGHRYVIRYELNAGMNPLTVFKSSPPMPALRSRKTARWETCPRPFAGLSGRTKPGPISNRR
jgi:hypothetical protein